MRALATRQCALLFAATVLAAPAVAIEWTLVAHDGQEPPGSPGDAFYDLYEDFPEFTSTGALRFVGRGSIAPQRMGVYEWTREGGLERIVAVDSLGPILGTPALIVQAALPDVALAGDAIEVMVPVRVQECPSRYSVAIYDPLAPAGSGVVLQPGAPAPGLGPGWTFLGSFGTFFSQSSTPVGAPWVNAHGERAFLAGAIESDPYCANAASAAYSLALFGPDSNGAPTLVAVDGQEPPNGPPGTALRLGSVVALADDGEVFFGAFIAPSTHFLYRWSAEAGLRVVYEEEPGSGTRDLALGAPGSLLFVRGPADAATLYRVDDANVVSALHAPGDDLPGLEADFVVRGVWSVAANRDGSFAFTAIAERPGVPGSSVMGAWAPRRSGELGLRLLQGDPAPALDGLTINEVSIVGVGNDGEIVVKARVTGSTIPISEQAYAYYLSRDERNPELLIGPGTRFEYDGAQRTVSVDPLTYDARSGQLAVRVYDADGRYGIFAASVPEPGAALAAAAAIAMLATLRRRR